MEVVTMFSLVLVTSYACFNGLIKTIAEEN